MSEPAVEPAPDIRIRMPHLQRATAALAGVWLAALCSCEATRAEQSKRDFVDEMVTELCAPGAFYLECWSVNAESCYAEMPMMVGLALPTVGKRLQPSEALRQHVFERVFFFHAGILSTMIAPKFEKEECMDERRWKHIPASEVGTMARLRADREQWRRERRKTRSAPATTVTPPAPSAGTSPEPSPGTGPAPAPAP